MAFLAALSDSVLWSLNEVLLATDRSIEPRAFSTREVRRYVLSCISTPIYKRNNRKLVNKLEKDN